MSRAALLMPTPRRGPSTIDQDNHEGNRQPIGMIYPILATSSVVLLVCSTQWARTWVLSGSAIESLLIIYGAGRGLRIFSDIPLWTVLATLNLLHAISSTSWLLHGVFMALCYPVIGITCLVQFDWIATLARKNLRRVLRSLHFTRDKIAFFNLPALEIDTDVDGLMVIRGMTFCLSTMTIVANGIELGLKMSDDIEIAMHCDEVTIPLFRRIDVGHVYGGVKGGQTELFFGDVDDQGDTTEDDIFGDTPLLRAATASAAEGLKSRPELRASLTGVSWMKDSSAKSGFEGVKTLSPDDDKAEKQYMSMLDDIRKTSSIYRARQQVAVQLENTDTKDRRSKAERDKDMRASVCAEIRQLPSIPHPPRRSIRVTTLQNLTPPYVRRFLHRLPFLYRLLLSTLSYFHVIDIASVNFAASGKFAAAMLQQEVFKHYGSSNAELRRVERRLKRWLADANFCLQLSDINALARVPLSSIFDIVTCLKFNDIMAFRTTLDTTAVSRVVRIGGADATVIVPSYLLPHHEHILPDESLPEVKTDLASELDGAEGLPNQKQAEQQVERVKKDETAMTISVHASLPATFDQSLLDFVAALVKATKIVELEKEFESAETQETSADEPDTSPALSRAETLDDGASITSTASETSTLKSPRFKEMSRTIRQSFKEGTSPQQLKHLAKDIGHSTNKGFRDLGHSTKFGLKKAWGGMVSDRWIARMVGKVALKLQEAQGNVGYSAEVPIALAPYRPAPGLESKLMP